MGDRILKKVSGPYLQGFVLVLIILVATLCYLNILLGVCALAAGVAFLLFCLSIRAKQKTWMDDYLENALGEINDTLRYAIRHHPIPLCVVDADDRIALANDRFRELYPDATIKESNIEQITGLKRGEFPKDVTAESHTCLTVGERTYKLISAYMNDDTRKSALIYWIDVTNHEDLKVRYNDERKCFAHVQIDNYDELMAGSPDDKKSLVGAGIDKAIRGWAAALEGSVVRYYTSKYFIVFEHAHLDKLKKDKFSILDEVRAIETNVDFPVSLSIGVGVGGKTPKQTDEYATFAIDLALGRGGDQAVVKQGQSVSYYGGTLQIVERRNKGKSRVMAHAIKQLTDRSSRVVIMGHKSADMDSFAAAVGVARLAMNRGKDAYILITKHNRSLDEFYAAAAESGEYSLIGREAALELTDKNTLLIVVDTHRPSFTEEPALLSRTENLIVIDHHRKAEEFIENATLTYMEPGASSTSELVTEILQYMSDKKSMTRLEAEMLLGGIIVDTNCFSVKTGVRTFEAASWLKQNGADTVEVRRRLQNDPNDFKQKAQIVANAEFLDGGIIIARGAVRNVDAQTINAQAADDLLDVKGARASFVVGETLSEVVISARSLGDVNVQTLMERLGGGGHLMMAAAQLRDTTIDEAVEKLREILKN